METPVTASTRRRTSSPDAETPGNQIRHEQGVLFASVDIIAMPDRARFDSEAHFSAPFTMK